MPDDEVGYGKPPESGKFRKGKSGNPKGRPKGSKNVSTIVEEALYQPVVASVNGKPTIMSKLQAVVTQDINSAAKGDQKASRSVRDWTKLVEPRKDSEDATVFHERDEVVIAAFLERVRSALRLEMTELQNAMQLNEDQEGSKK